MGPQVHRKNLGLAETHIHEGVSLVRYLIALWIALSSCQSLALAQKPFEYESVVQAARTYLAADKPDDALAKAEQAMRLDLARWEAYAIAGEALMKLNRYHEAENILDNAIERAPSNTQGRLQDILSQCIIDESSSIASSAAKALSQVQVPTSVANSSSSDIELGSRAKVADRFRTQGIATTRALNPQIATAFDVCHASSRRGLCESIGQLTLRAGRLNYSSRNGNQSFSQSCSGIADVSSIVRESHAAPSLRAFVAEGVALRLSGKEEVFFVNPDQSNADRTDPVDAILDAIKQQCHL